ncbi:DUF6685 family protein [Pectobacterium jejuense]|uniref:DUF6685 family protein n=1 Tax=Pectobacterium jejuense TaxID=2974022 RepID=UPI00380EB60C
MTKKIRKIYNFLNKIIDRLCRRSFSFRMNEGALLYLDDIRLYQPTADAATILQLESVFMGSTMKYLSTDLRNLLEKMVIRNEIGVPDFDFKKVESLTASKGFGLGFIPRINGSWFKNIHDWGRGMYPGENLRSETLEDWNDNVWHIEHEGFTRRWPVRVTYYGWYKRYVASNSGGSHHAAKVVYQANRDNLTYNRESLVEYLSINIDSVQELECHYFSFIFLARKPYGNNQVMNAETEFRLLLSNLLSNEVEYLSTNCYRDNITLAFISKEKLDGRKTEFEMWMTTAVLAGKIIPLVEYLKHPETFHTKPYIHEIRDIYIGTPYMN